MPYYVSVSDNITDEVTAGAAPCHTLDEAFAAVCDLARAVVPAERLTLPASVQSFSRTTKFGGALTCPADDHCDVLLLITI